MRAEDLPFLDLTAPDFSTRGPEVLAARDAHALARTPFGFAVLRYHAAGRLLRDRRCRQGSHNWPDKVALCGSFAEFWRRSIISLEGPAHKTQRHIVQAALAEDVILSMRPAFKAIAAELLNDLSAEFDFVARFSEPFAGRVIAHLMGLPLSEAAALGRDASTLGLAMGVAAKTHEAEVNAATDRLMARAMAMLEDPPAGSFAARLLQPAHRLGATDRQVLADLIVISIFGGVDTTRAQLDFFIAA